MKLLPGFKPKMSPGLVLLTSAFNNTKGTALHKPHTIPSPAFIASLLTTDSHILVLPPAFKSKIDIEGETSLPQTQWHTLRLLRNSPGSGLIRPLLSLLEHWRGSLTSRLIPHGPWSRVLHITTLTNVRWVIKV